MDLGLKGRVVLVTGSSNGIGRATAELFGAEGAKVMVTYRKNCKDAQLAVEAIRKAGGDGSCEYLELADLNSIQRAVRVTIERWGRIDVLVNNAVEWPAISNARRAIEITPLSDWQHLMRANIEGAFCAVQAVVPTMKAQRWGRIVSVSSVAATDGMPGFSWYSAAKASLHGMTRTVAKELGPEGILVNVVMPGATLTPRIQAKYPPSRVAMLAADNPVRRLPKPEEVAAPIVFLCSEQNTTVTGEVVRVSGGRK